MDKPLVSVIMCCYNQQEYVSQAIMSVLQQQCDFDFELIIGEDASTDQTADVCRKIQSEFPDRVVLLCNEKNKGLIRNYFDCISISRGEIIADCAGDDFWMGEDRLQHLVDAWRAHPTASIVYGNYADYNSADGSYTLHNTDVKNDYFCQNEYGPSAAARFLSRQMHPDIVLSTAIYQKTLLYNYLETHPEMFFNQEYPAEDISVTAALIMKGPAYYLNEVNLAYRVADDSISRSKDERKMFLFGIKAFSQTVDWALFLKADMQDMNKWIKRMSAWYVQSALRLGSKDGARYVLQVCRNAGVRLPWKSSLKYLFLQVFGRRYNT